MRWWQHIAATSLVIVLVAAPIEACAGPGPMAAGQTAGETAGQTVTGRFGGQDLLKKHVINPVTSSGTPMQTIDGKTSFSAQMDFPSSSEFLDVTMQPGPTGDLSTVIAGEDLNFDGRIDYSYQVPVPVSGVCANGIISCTPGTWSNCQDYRWTADTSGKVSLAPTDPDMVGGCYCINSSCGSNLVWSNAQFVLGDLGGGIVGAMQQVNPELSISNVVQDTVHIAYYGQDPSRTTDANDAPSAPAPIAPQQMAYYSNPGAITAATQNMTATQSADPSSLYNLISNFSLHRQEYPCQIRRVLTMNKVNLEDIIMPLSGTGSIAFCGPDCIDIYIGQAGDAYWNGWCQTYEEDYDFFVKHPEIIESAKIVDIKWNDYLKMWLNGSQVWSGPTSDFPVATAQQCHPYRHYSGGEFYMGGSMQEPDGDCNLGFSQVTQLMPGCNPLVATCDQVEICSSYYADLISPSEKHIEQETDPDIDLTDEFQKGGEIDTKILDEVVGKGEAYAIIEVKMKPDLCSDDYTIADDCSAFETRSDCGLQEEKVDGVLTYHDANPTNLVPLPTTETISQGECTETITQDWWDKDRVYLCGTPAYDFSDAKKRFGKVVGSASESGSAITFEDLQKSDQNTWAPSSGTIETMDLPPRDSCEKACKTRRPTQDTQAGVQGNASQMLNSTDSYDILYHDCVNGSCPAGPGEEILEDCQCIDDFAEAATVMQMLREAGKDQICSDGIPKN